MSFVSALPIASASLSESTDERQQAISKKATRPSAGERARERTIDDKSDELFDVGTMVGTDMLLKRLHRDEESSIEAATKGLLYTGVKEYASSKSTMQSDTTRNERVWITTKIVDPSRWYECMWNTTPSHEIDKDMSRAWPINVVDDKGIDKVCQR